MLSRPATGPLAAAVDLLWIAGGAEAGAAPPRREANLPTGALHLCLRLDGPAPRLLRHPADGDGAPLPAALVGGLRASPCLKAIEAPALTVGAVLRPGAALALLGAPGLAFADAHTPLDAVWGATAVSDLLDRLAAEPRPAQRLALFERALALRLASAAPMDAVIARAAASLGGAGVATARHASGYGPRHFRRRFRETVGLGPASFARVLRFARAVAHLHGAPAAPLADVAAAEGYADQSHLTRDFAELAGLTPGQYRRAAPRHAHHVPWPPVAGHGRFVQDGAAPPLV